MARAKDSSELAAKRSGGCGFWTGLGTTSTPSMSQNRPWKLTGSSRQARRITSMPSSKRSARSRTGMPSPSKWALIVPRPIPYSSRPPETMSSVAASSAARSGLCSGTSTTPVPSLIREVRAAAAAITTIGEGITEYSRRKCISASQARSKPSRSASTTCSIVSE